MKKEANKRDIYINQHKTKYMRVKRERKQASLREIQTGNYKFEMVDNLKYLGVMINNKDDRSRETEHRIQASNWAYYNYKSIMKSKEISRIKK